MVRIINSGECNCGTCDGGKLAPPGNYGGSLCICTCHYKMKEIRMIKIKKSPTADTRSCDYSKVSEEQLLDSSKMHIADVLKGMYWLIGKIKEQFKRHDWDKLEYINDFHSDFKSGFKTKDWY